MSSIYKNSLILFFSAVLVRIIFHWWTGFTADDAFISFRYAENLALGNGFVYNPGERVLGTSTPLFSFLMSLFTPLGIKPIVSSLMISLASSGMTAVMLYRMAHILRFRMLATLPAIAYILWPRCLPADISGMETAMFTMLIMAGFYYQLKEKSFYAIGAATLASVTRYEGFLLLLILIVVNGIKNRDQIIKYLAIPAIVVMPWMAFSQFYFGSVIPHSIIAKLALYAKIDQSNWWERLRYLLALDQPFAVGWLLLGFVIWGFLWMRKTQNRGGLELIWLSGMFLFYTASHTNLFFWYVSPLYPVILLFACASLVRIVYHTRFPTRYVQPVSIIVSVGAIILLSIASYFGPGRHYKATQIYQTEVHRAIGEYLSSHAVESDIIAAEDIGYIGYYSGGNIIDRDGLISPIVVPYNQAGNYRAVIDDLKPDWVVAALNSPISSFISERPFLKKYRLAKMFKAENWPHSERFVFERLEDAEVISDTD